MIRELRLQDCTAFEEDVCVQQEEKHKSSAVTNEQDKTQTRNIHFT